MSFDRKTATIRLTAQGVLNLVDISAAIPAGKGGLFLANFLNLVVSEDGTPVTVQVVKRTTDL